MSVPPSRLTAAVPSAVVRASRVVKAGTTIGPAIELVPPVLCSARVPPVRTGGESSVTWPESVSLPSPVLLKDAPGAAGESAGDLERSGGDVRGECPGSVDGDRATELVGGGGGVFEGGIGMHVNRVVKRGARRAAAAQAQFGPGAVERDRGGERGERAGGAVADDRDAPRIDDERCPAELGGHRVFSRIISPSPAFVRVTPVIPAIDQRARLEDRRGVRVDGDIGVVAGGQIGAAGGRQRAHRGIGALRW